ncbi:LLM class flavin-dependent oxidoreductase [Corynebacterium pacaense]|uniref:LLM class flavin-dependent oxidoreductase n=1 Tax=Corynebacterium pacaense TaxID=1816684 RepID=UPI001FEC3B6F|nr:LLM class flavin-dependent oxidoreductase [Corynebacterium pacaense]
MRNMVNSTPVSLHWFLPTYGDSTGIIDSAHSYSTTPDARGAAEKVRRGTLSYLTQIAQAAEANGLDSMLVPTGAWCQDPWVVASALIPATTTLKLMVAVRPGVISATTTAQMSAAFQNLSGNRLALNVVTGAEDGEQRAYGDFLNKHQRYQRSGEYLALLRSLWTSEQPITTRGDYVHVERAAIDQQPAVLPPVYFSGASDIALEIAAQHADVYLTWGETSERVSALAARVSELAHHRGRDLQHAIRFHVIARPTSEEAWAVASRLIENCDPEQVARVQRGLRNAQSQGQQRMNETYTELASFDADTDVRALQIQPGVWAGIGLVRGGAGTALVGSYEEVAELIELYRDAGEEHFVLSGYPHLEETFHIGEGVIPALRRRGVRAGSGDTVAGVPR